MLPNPANRIDTPKERIFFILIFGAFIFLFLFLFGPFGMAQMELKVRFLISLGFGLVTIFVLFIFIYLIEPVFTRGPWSLFKHIAWDLFIGSSIGVANYFYIIIITHQKFIPRQLLYSIWTAILVGLIPVTLGHIILINRKYRKALEKASVSDTDIINWESEVVIRGGNPKNEYRCNPKSIVYICSNDNYITVATINGELITKTHLRGTLKAAETELRNNTSFFRCHKCYIVNTEYADHITGNIQNMKIRLKLQGLDIPVSRSKAMEASSKFRR